MSGNRSYHSSDGFRKHILPCIMKTKLQFSKSHVDHHLQENQDAQNQNLTNQIYLSAILKYLSSNVLEAGEQWDPERLQDSQGNGQPPAAPSRLWQGRQISGSWKCPDAGRTADTWIPESGESPHWPIHHKSQSWSPVLLTVAHVINKLKHMDVLLAPLSCSPVELKVSVRHPRWIHRELEG